MIMQPSPRPDRTTALALSASGPGTNTPSPSPSPSPGGPTKAIPLAARRKKASRSQRVRPARRKNK